MKQKDEAIIAGIKITMALKFDNNHREKSPVIATVEQGNGYLKPGELIICHHNHFYHPSPYFLYDKYYSIPVNHTIFAILHEDGSLTPTYGNIIGERIDVESTIMLPPESRTQYKDRIRITQSSNPNYAEGQTVFTRPSAPYDIVYNFGGVIKRVTKIWDTQICGILK